MEIWKPIPSLENKYEASNIGRIRSNFGRYKGRIIKQRKRKSPNLSYYFVETYSTGKKVIRTVHRMIAEVFCENPNNYPIVMHLDNNRDNNNSENLKWGTLQMNSQQMIEEGRGNKSKGSKHYLSKLKENDVIQIKSKYEPKKYSMAKLAKEYNVTFGLISNIINNRSWKHVNI